MIAINLADARLPPLRLKLSTSRNVISSSGPDSMQHMNVTTDNGEVSGLFAENGLGELQSCFAMFAFTRSARQS